MSEIELDVTIGNPPDGAEFTLTELYADLASKIGVTFPDGLAVMYSGVTAPSSLTTDFWIKPEGDRYAIYVPDTSGNWVYSGIDTKYKAIYSQATDPFADAAAETGAIWFETSGSTVLAQKLYWGGAWVTIGVTQATIDDINTRVSAISNADGTLADSTITTSDVLTAAGLTEVAVAVGALLYPVGTIYTVTGDSRNPNEILGFGTWVAYGAGRVIIGQGTGPDGVTYSDGVNYGANSINLTEAQLPSVDIEAPLLADSDASPRYPFGTGTTSVMNVDSKNGTAEETAAAPLCNTSAWNGEDVDVRQASVCAYCWRRTA